jgi:hypothetical protein
MPGEIWLTECPTCSFTAEVETGADACVRCGTPLRPQPSICANHHAQSIWIGCEHRHWSGPCEECKSPLLAWEPFESFSEAPDAVQRRQRVPCPRCASPLTIIEIGLWD